MNRRDAMRKFKAEIFQALAHPTRIFIVQSLAQGEMTAGKISEVVGITQSNASQHLAILRNKHVVETRKDGNSIYYRLRDPLFGEMLDKMRQYVVAQAMVAMNHVAEDQDANASVDNVE
ncbi:MAG: winged helix-turn-helix transcriptional regulator [Pirellulaceae bacterium]|nr:winged helix-turn-helix transcriptional regulator [Pirellulaceae bacterium]